MWLTRCVTKWQFQFLIFMGLYLSLQKCSIAVKHLNSIYIFMCFSLQLFYFEKLKFYIQTLTPQLLRTAIFFSMSMNLTLLSNWYKCYLTGFVFCDWPIFSDMLRIWTYDLEYSRQPSLVYIPQHLVGPLSISIQSHHSSML